MYEQLKVALARHERMMVQHTFTPGQAVEWKQGLKNRRKEGPFVVSEVLDEPVLATDDPSGSQYFREPMDLLLGFVDTDDKYEVYHFDSRRFQPIK